MSICHAKLWDPRKQDAVRKYTHHFDFISDFLWLDDKKQLVATRYVFPFSFVAYQTRGTHVCAAAMAPCP